MKRKNLKALIPVLAMALALALPAAAEAPYGAAGVKAGEVYSLEEMLTFAIQDEYLARAEYEAIMAAYGAGRPFSSIMRAEEAHIARLAALFEAHGLETPADDARERVLLPGTPEEIHGAGVNAEENNIVMYEAFLAAEGLPEDVRLAFRALKNASENHLRAFERFRQNADSGLGRGRGRR